MWGCLSCWVSLGFLLEGSTIGALYFLSFSTPCTASIILIIYYIFCLKKKTLQAKYPTLYLISNQQTFLFLFFTRLKLKHIKYKIYKKLTKIKTKKRKYKLTSLFHWKEQIVRRLNGSILLLKQIEVEIFQWFNLWTKKL